MKFVGAGDIAFGHPKNLGFYSKAVRFFTKSKWSHCFFVGPDYCGELVAIEADLKVQVVPFYKEYIEKKVDAYQVYRPIKTRDKDVLRATKTVFHITAGETYGFLQIPWFAIRSILKNLFGWILTKNWKPDGVICSELLLIYIQALGGEYLDAFKHLKVNETSPQDIFEIVIHRPDLFEFICERE